MRGKYAIRMPYLSNDMIGVGGNPVPIEVGYNKALAKESKLQPKLDGGSSQMYETESETFLRCPQIEFFRQLKTIPNGSLLQTKLVESLRRV